MCDSTTKNLQSKCPSSCKGFLIIRSFLVFFFTVSVLCLMFSFGSFLLRWLHHVPCPNMCHLSWCAVYWKIISPEDRYSSYIYLRQDRNRWWDGTYKRKTKQKKWCSSCAFDFFIVLFRCSWALCLWQEQVVSIKVSCLKRFFWARWLYLDHIMSLNF